ncbi:hypothetical protein [Trichocoleus sp. FACHB-262]|uniref:hypothetical protein n=2 Tax=unclassified Trichocoleus TaxID=2628910 RepID=UPI0016863942|nr:hypothetical protein [Trichocoleus sp. FACHB-262]MBD2120971.1 hypothetical protein [Trichocoleus sp. FACHB-262]
MQDDSASLPLVFQRYLEGLELPLEGDRLSVSKDTSAFPPSYGNGKVLIAYLYKAI